MTNGTTRTNALENMHKLFLEALRHREQDIIRFLAILGPALGGFVWLLKGGAQKHPERFVAGTYGVLLVLVIGAFYALALGYNYRYLTLLLAKLEANPELNLSSVMLKIWPRRPRAFVKGSRIGIIPWCTPPGIIKVFWLAFVGCLFGVTVVASMMNVNGGKLSALSNALPWVGYTAAALAFFWPIHVGWKMLKASKKESYEEWLRDGTTAAEENNTMVQDDRMSEREERVELFKTLTVFAAMCVVLAGVVVPVLLWLAPGIEDPARYWGVLAAGVVALGVMGFVFRCGCLSLRAPSGASEQAPTSPDK